MLPLEILRLIITLEYIIIDIVFTLFGFDSTDFLKDSLSDVSVRSCGFKLLKTGLHVAEMLVKYSSYLFIMLNIGSIKPMIVIQSII